MQFTPEQIRIITDALEVALQIRLSEFEQNDKRWERESMQRAIRAARDIKRFDKLLDLIQDQVDLAS